VVDGPGIEGDGGKGLGHAGIGEPGMPAAVDRHVARAHPPVRQTGSVHRVECPGGPAQQLCDLQARPQRGGVAPVAGAPTLRTHTRLLSQRAPGDELGDKQERTGVDRRGGDTGEIGMTQRVEPGELGRGAPGRRQDAQRDCASRRTVTGPPHRAGGGRPQLVAELEPLGQQPTTSWLR
jgi:hypothetical protein